MNIANTSSQFDSLVETLGESSIFYLIRVDMDGFYTYVNSAFRERFGFIGDLVGDHVNDSVYEEDHPAMQRATLECFKDPNQPVSVRLRKPLPEGGFYWTDWEFKAIMSENGHPEAVQCIGYDVTELVQRNKELKRANQELDTFVYRVSHDLKAPLASSISLIDLAKMEQDLDKREQFLDYQKISLNRLDKFISDILAYSRNTRKKVEVSDINLKELVAEICKTQDMGDNTKLSIKIKEDAQVKCDEMRLRVVLNNLISNAFKYSKVKKEPKVDIEATISEREFSLQVADNGIGIPLNHQDKVFDMFYRATTVSQGSGLGLYIVKDALEKLNGTIKLQSQENIGTRFFIKIPQIIKHGPETTQ